MESRHRLTSTETVTTEVRRRRVRLMGLVAGALSVVVFGLGLWTGSWFGEWLCQLAGVGLAAAALTNLVGRVLPERHEFRAGGALVVGPTEIVLERPRVKRRIPRERILQGYVIEPTTLGLVLSGGEELRFELEGRAEAETTLRELGLEAAARPLTVPLSGYFGARSATIGVDGVTIERALGKRFIPYERIATVDEDPRGAVLTLVDGERVPLRVSASEIQPFESDGSVERRASLLARIRQAQERAGGARVGEATLARLDRGERTALEWTAALAHTATSDYRTETLEPDDLVRIACDPEVLAERRVGAALALATRRPESSDRVRVAAAACVDEDLRTALEAAAEGEVAEAELARVTARRR